jgi:hypothetical protein
MQLRERGFMQSDCIMGDIAGGYIFGRVLHCRRSSCKFNMLIRIGCRLGPWPAHRETERTEDECIIFWIGGHMNSRPALRRTGHRRVVDNRATVAVIGKFEVAERIGTVEIQRRAVRSIRHGERAVCVAIVDRVEIESFEIRKIRA